MKTKNKYMVILLMLVTVLLIAPSVLGATLTYDEKFTSYTVGTTPAKGTTTHTGYTFYNSNLSTIACYYTGHGDAKDLILCANLGQHVSGTLYFNKTGNTYSNINYWISPQKIGTANTLTITLNSIGNSVVFTNLSINKNNFTVKTGSTTIVSSINATKWYNIIYTFNWTTSKVYIEVKNVTSKGNSGWINFVNSNTYVYIRNMWSCLVRTLVLNKAITGLTFSGTTGKPCDFYVDNISSTCTYTPSWTLSNVMPYNNGACKRTPTCSVKVTRGNAVLSNISLYTWTGSNWYKRGSTVSSTASSYTASFSYTNATLYQHTYFWKLSVEDHGVYSNTTYRFTTWPKAVCRMLGYS